MKPWRFTATKQLRIADKPIVVIAGRGVTSPMPGRTRTSMLKSRYFPPMELRRDDWPDVTLYQIDWDWPKKTGAFRTSFGIAGGLIAGLDDPTFVYSVCLGEDAKKLVDDGALTLPEAYWNTVFDPDNYHMVLDMGRSCKTLDARLLTSMRKIYGDSGVGLEQDDVG